MFYLIYYTLLACFWIACLMIFFQVWKQTIKLKILQDQYDPLIQTLPSEVDGPKWQRDWGLIGSNPGVRLAPFWTTRLGLFLLFFHILLIFLQSTMITFQLGLRPQQRDSLIDSQMFVLKVFYLSHIFVMGVRFLADVCFLAARFFVKCYEL